MDMKSYEFNSVISVCTDTEIGYTNVYIQRGTSNLVQQYKGNSLYTGSFFFMRSLVNNDDVIESRENDLVVGVKISHLSPSQKRRTGQLKARA
jgi:hypothetical protein